MTTVTNAIRSRADFDIPSFAALFVIGALLVFVAAFANAAPLHSPAHDARHANGFACH